MTVSARQLSDFKKSCDFMIGVDSDGCAFDSMDFKHKECFTPATINVWNLQPVAKYARETWEFVNLYSESRGMNRFPALIRFFDLLAQRREVMERGFEKPDLTSLEAWVKRENAPGPQTLKKAIEETTIDEILVKTLAWSNEINENVAKMARNLAPFPFVRKSLEKASKQSDVLVVSATPAEALIREWNEHGIDRYVKIIAGQEMGTKKVHLELAKNGRYTDIHMLMIGDAIGDLEAAKANNILFFPIMPGSEASSWKLFYDEAFDKFIKEEYNGEYQANLHAEFISLLPTKPCWETR